MNTYRIPVIWQMWGIMEIEAESLEEAKEKAFSYEYNLPSDGSYIDDSFEIDEEGIEYANRHSETQN